MYYTFEGTDGVGKTTIMQGVARKLLTCGIDNFLTTKEPGGPLALKLEWNLADDDELCRHYGFQYETGPQVRDFCVNHPQIPQLAKRAMYKADSFCNWEHVIKPAIQSDEFIISDRSWVSDLVYGTVLGKLDTHSLFQFNMALIPQMHSITNVFCLTVPEAVREQRLSTNIADHMDTLGPQIRNELSAAYHTIIKDYIRRNQYWFIDANRPIEAIVNQIADLIMEANECL